MKTITDTVAAFVLLGMCIVAITILAALQLAVPDVLVTLALVLAGVSGGTAIPRARAEIPATPAQAPGSDVGVLPR